MKEIWLTAHAKGKRPDMKIDLDMLDEQIAWLEGQIASEIEGYGEDADGVEDGRGILNLLYAIQEKGDLFGA